MRIPYLLLPFGLLTQASYAQTASPAPSDSVRLQGRWRMVDGMVDGHGIPETVKSAMVRIVEGNHVRVTMGAQTFLDATITLHAASRPAAVDHLLVSPPNAAQLGIYRWVGDTLEFCFSKVGQPRPGEFKAGATDGRSLARWVRAN